MVYLLSSVLLLHIHISCWFDTYYHIFMCIYIYVSMYIFMCVCVYIYIYIYKYMRLIRLVFVSL